MFSSQSKIPLFGIYCWLLNAAAAHPAFSQKDGTQTTASSGMRRVRKLWSREPLRAPGEIAKGYTARQAGCGLVSPVARMSSITGRRSSLSFTLAAWRTRHRLYVATVTTTSTGHRRSPSSVLDKNEGKSERKLIQPLASNPDNHLQMGNSVILDAIKNAKYTSASNQRVGGLNP
jgi:hypothetical protein